MFIRQLFSVIIIYNLQLSSVESRVVSSDFFLIAVWQEELWILTYRKLLTSLIVWLTAVHYFAATRKLWV